MMEKHDKKVLTSEKELGDINCERFEKTLV